MKTSFLFAVLSFSFLFAGSVMLLNDSPFELTAIVQGADGSYLGQVTIAPGEQNSFVTDLKAVKFESPNIPDVSLTPYTVLWRCPYEGYYSTNTNVAPASLTRASDGSGPKYCAPKPEKEKNS